MSPHPVSPDAALFLLLTGVWLIYLECNRPGWVIPGCLGCLSFLFAAHALSTYSLRPAALLAAASGVAFLTAGIFLPARNLLATLGTVLLTLGLACLTQPNAPARVHPLTALFVGPALGVSTVWLGRIALKARRNKLANSRDRAAAAGCTG